MIYAFVQSSHDFEIRKRQRETILSYAADHGLVVNEWLDTTSFDPEKLKEKDLLLLEKTFRLNKNISSILTILKDLLNKGVIVCSCEDGLKFGEDYISSIVMANAFDFMANVAKDLHSRLTKESLKLRKEKGLRLGRPRGRKNSSCKWDSKKKHIQKLFERNKTVSETCRLLNIPRSSLSAYIKNNPELKPLPTIRKT